jgi:predicted MFS family arabinose efflux permease
VGVVGTAERTAAASYTNTARYVVRPGGSLLGGYVTDAVGVSSPFVIGGVLKIVYDLILLATFRRVGVREEESTG